MSMKFQVIYDTHSKEYSLSVFPGMGLILHPENCQKTPGCGQRRSPQAEWHSPSNVYQQTLQVLERCDSTLKQCSGQNLLKQPRDVALQNPIVVRGREENCEAHYWLVSI